MIPDNEFVREQLARLARAQVDIVSAANWIASQHPEAKLEPDDAHACLVSGWAASFYERERLAGLADVQMEAFKLATRGQLDRGMANAKLKAIADFLLQHKGYAKDGTSAKQIKEAEKLLDSLPPDQRKAADKLLKLLTGGKAA